MYKSQLLRVLRSCLHLATCKLGFDEPMFNLNLLFEEQRVCLQLDGLSQIATPIRDSGK